MDIIAALTPKNMTVREVADVDGSAHKAYTYVFNRCEYTHIGTWPPERGMSGFHVPIANAEIVHTNVDITHQLRRFAGPRHIITKNTVRYAMGTWSWRPVFSIVGFKLRVVMKPVLTIPDTFPAVRMTDVLGHVSVFCAK